MTAYYIISANCVGYNVFQNEDNPKVIIGVSFTEVGSTEGIHLNDLKGTFASWDSIQVSFTDKGKTKLRNFNYSLDGDIDDQDGWYSEEGDYVGDTQTLEWGQGAWLVTADPTALTTSGEVKSGNKIHIITEPKTLVCSYYPVPFCPNSANVTWSENFQSWDSLQVFYTENGKTKLRNFNYSLDGDIDDEDGWYTEEGDLLGADDAIAGVGEGFWLLVADFDGAYFSEVSPVK